MIACAEQFRWRSSVCIAQVNRFNSCFELKKRFRGSGIHKNYGRCIVGPYKYGTLSYVLRV